MNLGFQELGRQRLGRVAEAVSRLARQASLGLTACSIRASEAVQLWRERNRQMLPMNHVLADRMAPMHVRPIRAVRMMLIEQMILAVEIDRPVRIAHPVGRRQEVILRPVWIGGESTRGRLVFLRECGSESSGGAQFQEPSSIHRKILVSHYAVPPIIQA